MKAYAHDVVQVVIYRRSPDVQFLVLKRTEADGGWWQPVTGHIDAGESVLDALHRELHEETGMTSPITVSDEIYFYKYDTSEGLGRDRVYMVEVSVDAPVVLNKDEHETYLWLGFDDAIRRLKYDGNKESFRRANAIINQ